MELNHLKYFYVVAREGSFTRASRVLRIQQPTISKIVRQLESNLNLKLFERVKRGVRVTKAGGDIYALCEGIFERVDSIQSLSHTETSECQGLLSFGMTDAATTHVLPKIMRGFLKQHPKVRPSIFAGSSNLIGSEIGEGRVEFGIFFTRPDRGDFHVSELVDVPWQLVTATKDQPHSHSVVISRDIDYPKARPFPVLEMLNKNNVKVDILLTSNNLDFQKRMVLQGLGIALLPRFMVKSEVNRGTLTVLHPKKNFAYSLKLVTRQRKLLSRNSLVFLEELKKRLPEHL